jgi:hypothetical protein
MPAREHCVPPLRHPSRRQNGGGQYNTSEGPTLCDICTVVDSAEKHCQRRAAAYSSKTDTTKPFQASVNLQLLCAYNLRC